MNKILIVYIATGPYKAQYGGFRSSLELFCPDDQKIVVVMTDDPNYFSSNFYGDYLPNLVLNIPHQPWPIPTLLKFHYINQAMEVIGDFTHVCYFNANVRFNKVINHKQFFTKDKLTVTEHWGWTTYGNRKVSGVLSRKVTEGNAVIPTEDYIYVNAGVVGGDKNSMIEACNWIMNACNEDLKKCIIPPFHDESYLNAYCYKFKNKIKMMPSRFTYDSNRLRDLDRLGEGIPYIMYAESQVTQDLKY